MIDATKLCIGKDQVLNRPMDFNIWEYEKFTDMGSESYKNYGCGVFV